MNDLSIGDPSTDYGILEMSSEDIDLVSGGSDDGPIKKWINKLIKRTFKKITPLEVARQIWVNREKIRELNEKQGRHCAQHPMNCMHYY